MKIIVVVLILGILVALGSAMLALIRHKGPSDRIVKALTVRVGLSVALFAMLMLAQKFGLIQPHGVY
ncbi:twin transmembrane helix small protein [Chitinimonas arctica]|uniref:Twin transmembrane helix small protein n=1 Tax=Chitinimonas arctica TaxID=2594795 RepID=A0A516SH59_9NEIS|nr:twin transmembrane helix small protein [Chitinimonas arctica]QDQ27485.1 twin transmembrane helix small protein [Chitinimonas arctica]